MSLGRGFEAYISTFASPTNCSTWLSVAELDSLSSFYKSTSGKNPQPSVLRNITAYLDSIIDKSPALGEGLLA